MTENRTSIWEYRTPVTEYHMSMREYRTPMTEYHTPMAEYRTPHSDDKTIAQRWRSIIEFRARLPWTLENKIFASLFRKLHVLGIYYTKEFSRQNIFCFIFITHLLLNVSLNKIFFMNVRWWINVFLHIFIKLNVYLPYVKKEKELKGFHGKKLNFVSKLA